ncbi:MAG: hypothetical protein E5W00_01635 [Mesorhizobium sp.]|nr:MAG: hypothetical protein E5W00_01635 [Mesorhizobium sp.]
MVTALCGVRKQKRRIPRTRQIGIPVWATQLESGALNARSATPAKGGGRWDLLVQDNWGGPGLSQNVKPERLGDDEHGRTGCRSPSLNICEVTSSIS